MRKLSRRQTGDRPPPPIRGSRELGGVAQAVDSQEFADICAAAAYYVTADPWGHVTVKYTRPGGQGTIYAIVHRPGEKSRSMAPYGRPRFKSGFTAAEFFGDKYRSEKWARRGHYAKQLMRGAIHPVDERRLR